MKGKKGVMINGTIFLPNGKLRHLRGFSNEIIFAYMLADKISQQCYDIEIVITSGGGEVHGDNSCHYGRDRGFGFYIDAVDLRSNHYTQEQGDEFIVELREQLGPDYQVLDERKTKGHIHIQYNPS